MIARNDPMSNTRVVFASCVKNCAGALPRLLNNLSRVSILFAESAFIFVENDSTDSTKVVIRAWCRDKPNARLITLDGLDASCPVLTIRLETARNLYISEICSHFSSFDYLFVLDCDERAESIDPDALSRAIECQATKLARASSVIAEAHITICGRYVIRPIVPEISGRKCVIMR